MLHQDDRISTSREETSELSRRHAVKVGGGLAALAAAWMVSKPSGARAQDATPAATPADCVTTTPDENRAMVVRFHSAWDAGDTATLASLMAPDYQHHWSIGSDSASADAMISSVEAFVAAFSDLHSTTIAIVAEGDMVATYLQISAVQVAGFRGTPPVDIPLTWGGFTLFRFECGLIAESWNESDQLGRLMQSGAITSDEIESVGTPTP
jgi:predicted ester cyclase